MPFIANRVLRQLVEDEKEKFPLAASVLQDDFYMDDSMFDADNIPLLRQIREELINMLVAGGFVIRKWTSNDSTLLKDIPSEDHGLVVDKLLQTDEKVKVLGISWNSAADKFQFHSNFKKRPENKVTKRSFLLIIPRLFDSMGWLAPVTIVGNIYFAKSLAHESKMRRRVHAKPSERM